MQAVENEIDIPTEIARCQASCAYFIYNYVRLRDAKTRKMIPFRLWPAQVEMLKLIIENQFVVLMKARQTGFTSLCVGRAIHMALFQPGSVILVFSRGQKESKDIIRRIKAGIAALPDWMRPANYPTEATQELELSNGTRIISFASRGSGGDSYTADLAIVDEADLIVDLNELLEGLEPTIAATGQIILLSRVDKAKANSGFKRIYRASVDKLNEYVNGFIPWFSVPSRTKDWYERQRRNIETRTGALDDLYAQYPETPEQALAPRTLDRRFPFKWLEQCYEPGTELPLRLTPFAALVGNLRIYTLPRPGDEFIVGVDVALGNPNSDDSVCVVLNRRTLRQVAILVGKYEPGVLAHYAVKLGIYFNKAWLNIERNNHGVACIDEARKAKARILAGRDNKLGWWTDLKGKFMMYDAVAESLRCGSCLIVDKQTLDQLTAVEIGTLNAPEGEHDDCAVAFGLALHGAATPIRKANLEVLTYERTPATEKTATPSEGTHVEWIESNGEWWAQTFRDSERIDLHGSTDKAEAEFAGACADALLAIKGPVNAPLGDAPLQISVYQLLLDRGWIKDA